MTHLLVSVSLYHTIPAASSDVVSSSNSRLRHNSQQGTLVMADPDFDWTGMDIVDCAVKVLKEPDPWNKAQFTRSIVAQWRAGNIAEPSQEEATRPACPAPDRPARADDKVRLVQPGQAPRLGKGGSLSSRQNIIHSLCHIESWAIDLAWDAIARWGHDPQFSPHLPRQFYDDFVMVADDECRHFLALEERLKQLGSHYGALPAHDGLWESASSTSHNLAARLAVEHCVHEARGLDVLPFTIAKFRNNGDEETAHLLEGLIYPEEVNHCAAGIRWLKHLHALALETRTSDEAAAGSETEQQRPPHSWMQEAAQFSTVQEWFHHMVRAFFHGLLKPPFNEAARAQAGFDGSWFERVRDNGHSVYSLDLYSHP